MQLSLKAQHFSICESVTLMIAGFVFCKEVNSLQLLITFKFLKQDCKSITTSISFMDEYECHNEI